MQMQNLKPAWTACLAAGFLTAACWPAVSASAQTPQQLLQQSETTYKAMHSFSCFVFRKITSGSPAKTKITTFHVVFQAPDRLALTSSGFDLNDLAGADKVQTVEYLANGSHLLVCLPNKKQYFDSPSPDNAHPAFFVLADAGSFAASVLLCQFGMKPLSDLAQDKSARLGLPEEINGVEVQVITGVLSRKAGVTTKYSLALGTKDHFVYRFVSTAQGSMRGGKQSIVRELCSDIRVNPVLPPSVFLPPPGAAKVKPDQNYVGGQ